MMQVGMSHRCASLDMTALINELSHFSFIYS